ncbi:MAG: hypothetical protein RL081_1054 [Pseudomonadota bacterium]
MQVANRDAGPDTVIEDGAPDDAATAPLQRSYLRMLSSLGVALLVLVSLFSTFAYQRERTQLQNALHAQGTLTQQALDMQLAVVRNHVASMRYAMERSLRWPVLADSGFFDRVQQRNLSPLRDAPWERLPVDLVRDLGSWHMDANAVLDAGSLRRDLGAASAMLPSVVSQHANNPVFLSSYYIDGAIRWRLSYPPQGREERLMASGATDMQAALLKLWPSTDIKPMELTSATLKAQHSSVWTPPFFTGKGLAMGLLAPVLAGPEQVGAVGVDVGLDLLDSVLVQHAPRIGRALVVTADGWVLGDSAGTLNKATKALRLIDVVPDAGTPWRNGSADPDWQRFALQGTDWFLLLHQPPGMLRSAALGALKPYFALIVVVLAVLGGLAYWQNRHFTLPALQLVQYVHQLEQSPQRKAPPAPALWEPWFAQLAQAARERHTRMSATLRHAQQQQSAQEAHRAEVDTHSAALVQAQAKLHAAQQQLVRAERMAALGPVVTKATQTLFPLLTQAQQTALALHAQNERLQQGLLHSASTTELQQEAAGLDKVALALAQQLQGMVPVVQGLRQASTDPTRETPRLFRLHDLAAQVLQQLPASAKRDGIHIANGIPRDIELTTRASACGQALAQLLTHTVGQAFANRGEGIVRMDAKAYRQDDGVDMVVLSVHDNGVSHGAALAEHTQRALVQGALGGQVSHVAAEGANMCTLHLVQHLDETVTAASNASSPEIPTI